jgi:hypothetical protein
MRPFRWRHTLTRIVTIFSGVLLALTMSSIPQAHACISCEYTPEVANSPSKAAPKKRAAKPQTREHAARPQPKRSARVEQETRRERPAPSRSRLNRDDRQNKVARRPEPKTIESDTQEKTVAAPAPAVEPVKTVEPGKLAEPPVTETTEAQPASPPPSTTASRALSEADAAVSARNEQPQTSRSCKKYLPGAGVTITVPCE